MSDRKQAIALRLTEQSTYQRESGMRQQVVKALSKLSLSNLTNLELLISSRVHDATQAKKYNGWTNYETWNVKLWMDNEQGTYEYYREQARECWKAAKAPSENAKFTGIEPFTRDEKAALRLARLLRDEYETAMHDWLDESGKSACVWADLLGAALGEVNWDEIARSMVDDMNEDDKQEDSDDENSLKEPLNT
jgi:hypothetical protein